MSRHTTRSPVRRRAALAAAIVLATAGLVVDPAPAARAQTQTDVARRVQTVPDPDISSYVLFGFDELSFKGGQGNHGVSIIDGGNIGVNATGFPAQGYRMSLCANARMRMSDNTMVVSDTLRLGDRSTAVQECDVHQVFNNIAAPNNEESRTGPARPFTPPVIKATPPFPDFTCGGTSVTVGVNQVAVVPPGTYSQLTFNRGSTVTLTSGTYTICGLNTGQHVTVITQPGVVLQVAGGFLPTDDLDFGGPGCDGIPIVYVRGDGVGSNDNSVRFGQDSTVWGHFYAPRGQLNLGNQTDLHGTFWAREINSDFNVDVEYCQPPLPEPETGTIKVTKKVTGADAGVPPDAEFTIHYNCTIPSPGVRNALDGSFTLAAGETKKSKDVLVGTTCTVREVRRSLPRPGFVYEPAEFVPSRTVTVTTQGQTVGLVIENPLRAVFGTIRVHKEVVGDTDGYRPGSRFSFSLDCDGDAFDTTFSLAAGESFLSDPIRVGVPCTVRETALPRARAGFDYQQPVLTPASGEVTIRDEDQTVTVRVDNRLVGHAVSPGTGTGPIGPSRGSDSLTY